MSKMSGDTSKSEALTTQSHFANLVKEKCPELMKKNHKSELEVAIAKVAVAYDDGKINVEDAITEITKHYVNFVFHPEIFEVEQASRAR